MRLDSKTLAIIDTILNEDQTTIPNPTYRYWGGLIEEYYLLIWCKYQATCEENKKYKEDSKEYKNCIEKEIRYDILLDIFRKKYPHLKPWLTELIGRGLKIC